MKKCPRCHSSMVSDIESIPGTERRVWKCIGCGREVLQDESEQAKEDLVQEQMNRDDKPVHRRSW